MRVEQLVLEEDDGVIVADGGLQQPLRVLRRAGRHDLQAGEVAEEVLKGLGVLTRIAAAGTHRRAENHRTWH